MQSEFTTELFSGLILITGSNLCSKMHGFPECFSDFELCRPAISKPVVLEKSDIPQKKALNSGN